MKRVATSHTLVGNDTAEPWIWRGEPYLGRGEEQPGQCGSSVCFLPTELGAIELKIRTLNAINERYRALMGLDTSLTNGNAMYQFLHTDLDPLLDRVNQQLALTSEQPRNAAPSNCIIRVRDAELRSPPNATDSGLSTASCGPYDVRVSIQQEALMAAVLSSRDTQSVRSAWRGSHAGTWTTRVDVREFIQKNYTPYEGDERFLASATERTRTLWQKLLPFRRCRKLLSVMLGVQPAAQTQAVYRSLKETPVERTTPDQIKVEQGRARTEKMEDPASVSA